MSTIQPEELALVSTNPRVVRAAVKRALRERARADHSPRAAARLARDFLERLDRSGACAIEGASPRILALVAGRLHEDYCDALGRWTAPPKRRRGRPPEQTSDLEKDLLLVLSAIQIREMAKAARVAAIVSGFWDVRVSGAEVRNRSGAYASRHRQRVRKWQLAGADPLARPPGYSYDLPSRPSKDGDSPQQAGLRRSHAERARSKAKRAKSSA